MMLLELPTQHVKRKAGAPVHHDHQHKERVHKRGCKVCGNTPCLRTVDGDGYCKDHTSEAWAAMGNRVKEAAR